MTGGGPLAIGADARGPSIPASTYDPLPFRSLRPHLPGVETYACSVSGAAASPPGFGPAAASLVRRQEFAAGRACAAAALEALRADTSEVGIAHPHRYPRFPEGFVGSISHSGALAMACAARADAYTALGIDTEVMAEREDMNALAHRIMMPEEIERFRALPKAAAKTFFYLCFSAKEALFKCLFPLCETFMEFTDAQLVREGREGRFRMKLASARIAALFPSRVSFDGVWTTEGDRIVTVLVVPRCPRLVVNSANAR